MNTSVSVIVPIYNVEKYLAKCLTSISKQSFSDFEVILVDDGSTDNSKNICKQFIEKDNRFNYFHKKNGGLSDARNYGLTKASGKYVVFIDSDDYIEKDYIEVLYKGITFTNSEVYICSYYEVDMEGKKLKEVKVDEDTIVTGKEFIRKHFIRSSNVADIVAWNKIYVRDIFKDVKYTFGKYFEDEFIFVPLFWNVDRVGFVHKPEYNYVQRDGSIIKSKFTKKKLSDNFEFRDKRINFFKNRDKELYNAAIQEYKYYIINMIKNNNILLKDSNLKVLQEKYNFLIKIGNTKTIKNKAKDFIGKQNLKLFNIKHYYGNKSLNKNG